MTLRGDDLAYATLDYIREHPEEWDQGLYMCGSTACFAGRAVLLAYGENWEAQAAREFPEAARVTNSFFYSPSVDGEVSPGMTARKLLGWNANQADAVFRCYTSDFSVLETQVKRVLNGEVLYAASSQGSSLQVRMAGHYSCLHPGGASLSRGGDCRHGAFERERCPCSSSSLPACAPCGHHPSAS